MELMNQKMWSGLTATAFATLLGTTAFFSFAQPKTVASDLDSSNQQKTSSSTGEATDKGEEGTIAIVYSEQWKEFSTIKLGSRSVPATISLSSPEEFNKTVKESAEKQKPGKTLPAQAGTKQMRGIASWYGPGFHGRQTANGERFNQNDMTAAHRSLPFGTKVRVTNSNNGRSVVVRINDRGPFIGGRVIDLSAAAAQYIGMDGIAPVNIEILGQ
jgi:rare lipoprotein A (peptidoglycan hydrolase)